MKDLLQSVIADHKQILDILSGVVEGLDDLKEKAEGHQRGVDHLQDRSITAPRVAF